MDAEPVRGEVDRKRIGMLTMVAGGLFFLGALLSEVADWLWVLILVGFVLLIYVLPKLHAFQAPADGAAGEWGPRLVAFGAGIVVLLGVISLVWDAVGTLPEDSGVINVLWPIGFFAFLIGIVAFTIGTFMAKVFPQAAPALMLIGLVGAIAIDMATGAFFEDEPTTTPWGFIIGVPLFGLGVAWMGYSLWQEETTSSPPPVEAP